MDLHPCNSVADDDHMRRIMQPLRWRFKFQEVMVASHVQPIGFFPKGIDRNLG